MFVLFGCVYIRFFGNGGSASRKRADRSKAKATARSKDRSFRQFLREEYIPTSDQAGRSAASLWLLHIAFAGKPRPYKGR